MWTWSISGAGELSGIIASIEAQTSADLDADSVTQFEAAKIACLAQLRAMPAGNVSVSISGNATVAVPMVIWSPARS